MDKEDKIIGINGQRKGFDIISCDDEVEDWEDDYNLLDKGNFEELKKLREIAARNNPKDINALWRLGEAYILCKEYVKAIEYFKPLHKKNPDNLDISYSILDSLFALGKNENDFEWVSEVAVIRLDRKVSDFCYEYLKGKRKPRYLDDVYCRLIVEGYLAFNEEELLKYLDEDGRFELQKDGNVHFTLLKVQGKKKNK